MHQVSQTNTRLLYRSVLIPKLTLDYCIVQSCAALCVPPVFPSSQSLVCFPGSPLRKGGREDIWNWPMHRSQLPVTCGDKEGFLHRDKLAKGEGSSQTGTLSFVTIITPCTGASMYVSTGLLTDRLTSVEQLIIGSFILGLLWCR